MFSHTLPCLDFSDKPISAVFIERSTGKLTHSLLSPAAGADAAVYAAPQFTFVCSIRLAHPRVCFRISAASLFACCSIECERARPRVGIWYVNKTQRHSLMMLSSHQSAPVTYNFSLRRVQARRISPSSQGRSATEQNAEKPFVGCSLL